ncbi:hypothetical protein ABGB12_27935 [Actinocorallia sp. B10E7]|uniref:hypothetical protein n=1 Tax=Actinocorallia sp. B10E7 TaxID=3153558 RepID=UPI00325D7783
MLYRMSNTHDSRWEQWLSTLPEDKQDAAVMLRDRFIELGADAPEEWAQSEVDQDIPQLARLLILRQLWAEGINGWERPGAVENTPAAHRLLEAGANRADLITAMRAAAFEAISTAVDILQCHSHNPGHTALPGWSLQETTHNGQPTGRHIDGLNEDLRGTDPSGHEADDLWT